VSWRVLQKKNYRKFFRADKKPLAGEIRLSLSRRLREKSRASVRSFSRRKSRNFGKVTDSDDGITLAFLLRQDLFHEEDIEQRKFTLINVRPSVKLAGCASKRRKSKRKHEVFQC
jgi:hypothetical protein